jgi:hypothetical protein
MRNRRFVSWVLGFFAIAAVARGDIKTSGEILGTVQSEDKSVLPGATVTLTGAGLIQKSITQTSTSAGRFRFSNLNPGTYTLTVSLAGFTTREVAVTVAVGKASEVDVNLALAKTSEAVTVQAEAGLVDKTSPQISTNYTAKMLQEIPVGNSREWVELMDTTAGIIDKGAYGTGNGLDPDVIDDKYQKGSISSAYHLNGIDVSNIEYGSTWINPEYDTIQEVQVLGPGASAEYTNFTGAVVNLVTKSGSNDLHGSFSTYYTGKGLVSDNSSGIEDLKVGTIKYAVDSAVTLGGPIIKEKLLFFGAVGYHPSSTEPPQATVFDKSRQMSYQARMDYLVNSQNTISGMFNANPIDDTNLGLQPGSGPEIGYHYLFNTDSWYGSWQSVWSSSTFTELKYAGYTGYTQKLPNAPNTPAVFDYGTSHQYFSAGFGREFRNRRQTGSATVTHFVDKFLGASHDLKAGAEYEDTYNEDFAYATGGAFIYLFPLSDTLTYVGGGLYAGSRPQATVRRAGAFIQDEAHFGKGTTLSVGLRYDHPQMYDYVTGETLTKFSLFSPRVGISQTLGADSRTVLHAFYGRYYDKLIDYSIPFVAGSGISPAYYYNFTTSSPVDPTDPNLYSELFQPANYSYAYNSGKMPIDPNLKEPHTDAWTFAVERQIGNRFAVAGRFIYKKDRDFHTWTDVAPHTFAPLVYDPGSGLAPVTVYTRTDSLPNQYITTNSDFFFREHKIATLELQGTPTTNLTMRTSLTWERNTGTIENNFSGLGGFSIGDVADPNIHSAFADGILTYDRTWQFKLLGTYRLPWQAYVTTDLRVYSGRAWTPTGSGYSVPGFQDPNFFGNATLLLEPRGDRRWEATKILNLRLAKLFNIGSIAHQGATVELGVDVANVFNDDSPVDLNTYIGSTYYLAGGSSFGKPSKLVKPRQARFGARLFF